MLLHVLLIVLFGNSSGSLRRSESWWGPLEVNLGPSTAEPDSGFRLAPGVEAASPGFELPRPSSASPAPAESPSRALPSPQRPRAPAELLPRLNPNAPQEVNKALVSPEVSPAATIAPIAPPSQQRELVAPAEVPPRAIPLLPATPIEKAIVPSSEPLVPPVELSPRAVPVAPSAPLEHAAEPVMERQLAPPLQLPAVEKPAVTAPLQGLPPAPIESQVLPPVEVPVRELPMSPGAPLEPLAPPRIERQVAPPLQMPARQVEQPVAPVAPSTPLVSPVQQPAAQQPGKAGAGEDLLRAPREIAAPPAEAPHIDLEAARRKAAREIVDEGAGSRGVFSVPPPPPVERPTKNAMDKALKPDCRTAYANLGLLAVPALMASAVATDPGCRW